MSETIEKTELEKELNELKKAHDLYATAHHILSHRVQFYAEEFKGVEEILEFFKKLAQEIKAKVETLEPKEKAEEKTEAE